MCCNPWLIRYESYLVEVKRELREVNRKLEYLVSLSTVDHTSRFHDFSAPSGPDQTRIQNGPLGLEFNALDTHPTSGVTLR